MLAIIGNFLLFVFLWFCFGVLTAIDKAMERSKLEKQEQLKTAALKPVKITPVKPQYTDVDFMPPELKKQFKAY